MAIIALLTDFGLMDPYVGQMKAVLAHLAPDAAVVDITHEVKPYALSQAGYFLAGTLPHLPDGSVFIVVVDPGVGGPRRIICLDLQGKYVLAPDNGVCSLLVGMKKNIVAYTMDITPYQQGSATFHGRDIFAPMAAQLSLGLEPEMLGQEIPLESLERMPLSRPKELDNDGVLFNVVHVDRFGNVVLNAPSSPWRRTLGDWPQVHMRAPKTARLERVRSYFEMHDKQPGILVGSQGFLELALNMDSAANYFALDVDDKVLLAPTAE